MRFSACYKLIQLSGIFWNQYFLPYGVKWCGWGGRVGGKHALRGYFCALSDGSWGGGFVKHRRLPKSRFQNIGYYLLEFFTPHISVVSPWTWNLFRQLKVRSYRANRYKLSLPARAQRTRSNSATTRRLQDRAAFRLRSQFSAYVFGYLSRKTAYTVKATHSKKKGAKSLSAKKVAPKGSKKTIRTKKKDAWK